MAYLPHTPEQEKAMLEAIGVSSTESLFHDIPDKVRLKRALALPSGLTEQETWQTMSALAAKNYPAGETVSFLGAGVYEHYCPKAVQHILSRSEFYTAYTPYQPEISQGTLQAIFEYQTHICELTGMDAANASLYDGATAMAEASLMAVEATRRGTVLVSELINPEYRRTLATYLHRRGIKIRVIRAEEAHTSQDDLSKLRGNDVACVIVASPNFFGGIEQLDQLSEQAHEMGALFIACVDPISLGVLESPGEQGADIVVAEGQSLGLPMSFGGPNLGILAVKEKNIRRMPGRIVGLTSDRLGRKGFCLTLQAREQHIRREKASSNICSNEALCALSATIYLSLMGPQGLAEVSRLCLANSNYAKSLLAELPGVSLPYQDPTFQEFVVQTEEDPASVNERLLRSGILGGLELRRFYPDMKNHLLICVTEVRTRQEIEKLASVWGGKA